MTKTTHTLAAMRAGLSEGKIADTVTFQPGLSLHADPALRVSGRYRSPTGRLLELEVSMSGAGNWAALHIALEPADQPDCSWIGFTCRSAAPTEQVLRPCLRTGTEDGFVDCFFDKHILATPEPLNHVDSLHIETRRDLPETAPWRELVLFLPTQDFRWDLHDLRLFMI